MFPRRLTTPYSLPFLDQNISSCGTFPYYQTHFRPSHITSSELHSFQTISFQPLTPDQKLSPNYIHTPHYFAKSNASIHNPSTSFTLSPKFTSEAHGFLFQHDRYHLSLTLPSFPLDPLTLLAFSFLHRYYLLSISSICSAFSRFTAFVVFLLFNQC